MESAAHAYREVISGLVEERILPIFGQVRDFLGFRDADEKFLDPLKSTTNESRRSSSSSHKNNNVDSCAQPSVSSNGGAGAGGGGGGHNRARLAPLQPANSPAGVRVIPSPAKGLLNGQLLRPPFGPLANCNGTTPRETPPGDRRGVPTTADQHQQPSMTTGHCHSRPGGDASLGNGYHATTKSWSLRGEDNYVSNGRHLLDFSIFSFNNSENRSGTKGNRSDYGASQTNAQPTDPCDQVNSSAGQMTIQNIPDHPVTSDDPEATGPGEKLGRLQFTISYDFQESTLTLRIIRAVDLVAKDFSGTSDPYVKIMLLPDKKRKMTTNVKRKNLNPRWNEVFAFEGFPYNKLLTRTLYLQVLDYDRFSRDDPIGEICIPMTDIDLARGQTLWKNLQISKGHAGRLGEVKIGLCYQPNTGQLTVVVHEARQLKAKDLNGLSDPYVKTWLLYDGKKTEKKKTTTKEKTLNPVFEETFVFAVPYERIRQASVSVSVMDYDRMGRNEQIGQVVLGAKSGSMEMKHWNEMFAKTRQEVTQWHILKDLG